MPEAWAAELDRRFAEACRAAEKRFERRQLAKQSAERLPTLVPEIEALAENPSYNDIRSQWYSLRKQWQAIARDVEIDADLRARYDAAAQKLEAQEQTHRDAKGQQQVENLQRLQALVQKFETRAAAEALTLKQTDQLMKDVKLAVGTMGPLPAKQDREDLMVRLQAVRTSLTPRIQELREAEEWKRWANVQVQEELCAKMEALVPLAETDPEKASNEMRTLQERWKPVAAAPRSQAETLWTRFKTAQEQVYDKCKDFFAQQAAERVENLKKKEVLCARAESMSDSTDWVKTADAMKALQAEWKAIGPVTRGNEKAVWERFRAACDKFFTRRQDDLKQRKQDWTENLKRKEALVAEAKQLSRIDRVGAGGVAHQAAAGRLEDDRSGEEEQVGRDLERVPRRVRSVLRALQESRSGGAAGQDGRSRIGGHRARSVVAGRRCAPMRRRPTISTRRCRPLARAGCRDRSCRATRWRRWPSASMPRSSIS